MKLIIFAGGAGTRLWPISRVNSPKQFEKLVGTRSTLQMAIERVMPFGIENIIISTNKRYKNLVKKQLPEISGSQLFLEPEKRDLAAAVGLSLARLKKQGYSGTIAVLWSDHFVKKPENFREALRKGEKIVENNQDRLVFLAENYKKGKYRD